MKMKFALAAAVASAALASGAVAQDRIRAQDPATLESFFFDEGIPAKTETDPWGDPAIQTRKDDVPVQITFYECTDNANCLSIRLASWFAADESIGLTYANTLNGENRFITVTYDEDGDLFFFRDQRTGDTGMSRDDFRFLFEGLIAVVLDAYANVPQE